MSESPPDRVVSAALEAWAEAGRVSRVCVEGESMRPLLLPTDHVLVQHGRTRLRRGQVLACWAGERVVVHRLVRKQGDRLYLAGDNRPEPDAAISASEVLGRVLAVESGGTLASLDTAMARALGWTIAVLLPLRRRRGWRRLPRMLAALNARVLRG